MATAALQRPETKRLWTYDEMSAELPESNLPTELWDGEIVMSPAPRPSHQTLVLNLAAAFNSHVRAERRGRIFISPVDVVFSGHKTVQPDVVFVSESKASMVQSCIRGVPDLLVEVISEGSWRRDRIDKKALYEQFGVAEYWIVEPDSRLIEVFALHQGAYQPHARGVGAERVSSFLLPALEISFDEIER